MKRRHLTTALVVLAALAGVTAGCGGSSGGSGGGSSSGSGAAKSGGSSKSSGGGGGSAVGIANFAFKPASLTVKGGAKVTVTNNDSTAHTATADDGKSFDTGNIDPNNSAKITLSKAGTYKYHCSIHPFMHGTLVVK